MTSRPLTRAVWIWFTVTSLVICLFVGFFYYAYIHYDGGKTLIRMDQPLTDLFMPLMMMFHAPKVRWFRRQARTSGGSLLLATWMVGCFFFYWLYRSNLEANLAIIEYEKPIDRYEGSTYFIAIFSLCRHQTSQFSRYFRHFPWPTPTFFVD